MYVSMTPMLWMPPGLPVVSRLGMIQVWPGEKLIPIYHEDRLIDFVQSMVDEAGISQRQLDKLVYRELADRGFDVCYRDLRHAGKDLVEYLADNLRVAGALISTTVRVGDQPVCNPWHRKLTIADWIKTAALILPPKVS